MGAAAEESDLGAPATARAEDDPWATFDRWASNLFLVLAVLGFVVLLTLGGYAGATTDLPPGAVMLTLGILGVSAGLLALVSFGLSRRRPWARASAAYLLVILVVTGLGGAVLDLAHGGITIPLAALAAIYVLSRRPGRPERLAARDRRVAIGLSALFLVATVSPAVVAWLATP